MLFPPPHTHTLSLLCSAPLTVLSLIYPSLSQIALAMCSLLAMFSLLCSLSVLDSSTSLWLFSFSHIHNINPPLNHIMEWSCHQFTQALDVFCLFPNLGEKEDIFSLLPEIMMATVKLMDTFYSEISIFLRRRVSG